MKKIVFEPNNDQVRILQKKMFLEHHIALILQENIKQPSCRFDNSSIFDERTKAWKAQTRLVKVYKTSTNLNIPLKMQILKPVVNNRYIKSYHIEKYGIVIDKQTGRVICLVEGNFQIVEQENNLSVEIKDEKASVILTKEGAETPRYVIKKQKQVNDKKENIVDQDAEILGIHDVKESAYSWKACLLRKFIAKNLEQIKEWPID